MICLIVRQATAKSTVSSNVRYTSISDTGLHDDAVRVVLHLLRRDPHLRKRLRALLRRPRRRRGRLLWLLWLLRWLRLWLRAGTTQRRRSRRTRRRRGPRARRVPPRVVRGPAARPGAALLGAGRHALGRGRRRAPVRARGFSLPVGVLVDAGQRGALAHAGRRAGHGAAVVAGRPGAGRGAELRGCAGTDGVLADVVHDLGALRGRDGGCGARGADGLGALLRLRPLPDELGVRQRLVLLARERGRGGLRERLEALGGVGVPVLGGLTYQRAVRDGTTATGVGRAPSCTTSAR